MKQPKCITRWSQRLKHKAAIVLCLELICLNFVVTSSASQNAESANELVNSL